MGHRIDLDPAQLGEQADEMEIDAFLAMIKRLQRKPR